MKLSLESMVAVGDGFEGVLLLSDDGEALLSPSGFEMAMTAMFYRSGFRRTSLLSLVDMTDEGDKRCWSLLWKMKRKMPTDLTGKMELPITPAAPEIGCDLGLSFQMVLPNTAIVVQKEDGSAESGGEETLPINGEDVSTHVVDEQDDCHGGFAEF
ncbi:hypothetical protein ACLOJK_034894 [Asimina triloba]